MQVVRRPRLQVLVNSTPTFSVADVSVSSSRTFEAATFQLDADYATFVNDVGQGWADEAEVTIEIQVSLGSGIVSQQSGIWTTLLTGTVDIIEYDPATSRLVLSGRDRSAALIDTPLTISYLNRTSSEIVTALCGACGLQADVQQTTMLVGQYYQIQHNKTSLAANSRHANGWDLLVELASLEGFDLWVDGNVVHFTGNQATRVDAAITYNQGDAVYVSPTLNVSSLSMRQTLGLSRPIQVSVISWNSRQKVLVKTSYPDTAADSTRSFTITKPNLMLDEAQALAKSSYLRLAQQGRVISCGMAGELSLTARSVVSVTGIGSPWDGQYAIDHLERRISYGRGYEQHFTARAIDGEGFDAAVV